MSPFCPDFEFADSQELIDNLSDDSLILDIGSLRYDLPYYMNKVLPLQELSLDAFWKSIDFPVILPALAYNVKGEKEKRYFCNVDQFKKLFSRYKTVFWTPHLCGQPDSATFAAVEEYRVLGFDLDEKIDPYFWTKTRDLFKIWNSGQLISSIPKPSYAIFSGGGLHLYWALNRQYATDILKDTARIVHKIMCMKLSAFYDVNIDNINAIQPFRVPDSQTKQGLKTRGFKVINGFSGSLYDFIHILLSEEERVILSSMQEDEISYTNTYKTLLKPYGDLVGVNFGSSETDVQFVDNPRNDEDTFNENSVGKFVHIIKKDSKVVKKIFAMKCIYALQKQAPIQCGSRDLKLFGLSVGLAKCGMSIDGIISIVNAANEKFCEEPLSFYHLRNCYADPYKYIKMTQQRLKHYLGITKWPLFYKRVTHMSRSDAGRNAATSSKRNAVRKLKNALLLLGFNSSIYQLCKVAGISRQTYYRYMKNGVLKEIYDWYLNNIDSTNMEHMENMLKITGFDIIPEPVVINDLNEEEISELPF